MLLWYAGEKQCFHALTEVVVILQVWKVCVKIKFGSGGIRTHASEETGALNQRLRPLGHATDLRCGAVFPLHSASNNVDMIRLALCYTPTKIGSVI